MNNTVLENFVVRKIQKKQSEFTCIWDYIKEFDNIIDNTKKSTKLRPEFKMYMISFCESSKKLFVDLYTDMRFLNLDADSVFKLILLKRKLQKPKIFSVVKKIH